MSLACLPSGEGGDLHVSLRLLMAEILRLLPSVLCFFHLILYRSEFCVVDPKYLLATSVIIVS